MTRTLAALVTVLVLALLGSAPAAAETPTPSPTPTADPWTYISYEGELQSTDFSRDGQTSTHDPLPLTVTIRCGDDGCVLSGIGFGDSVEHAITGASGSWTTEAIGSICGDAFYAAAGTMTAEATADEITITQHLEPSATEFCPSESYQWGSDRTFVGAFSGGDPCVLEGAPCPPEPTAAPVAAEPSGQSGSPRPLDEPSILSTLPTPAQTLAPSQVLVAVVLTIVLVILMALPTHLLNQAVEKGGDRLSALLRRAPRRDAGQRRGVIAAALGVLAAAVISCFVDPAFGTDIASARTLGSVIASFALDVGLGWLIVVLLVRRFVPGATPVFSFAPLSLLVVVATVLFSRITGFEPGLVFGLVAGVGFGAALAAAQRARVTLVALGWGVAVAVLGWIGYAALGGVDDPGGWIVLVRETLASAAIAGIAALPIALIPLRGLSGYDLFAWNRVVWAAAYAVGLLGFFLVLLPMPFSWDEVGASLAAWVGLYLLYAVIAVALWLVIVRPWRREVSHS
ncbi:hypothetical protein [Schumannella luteola]